MDRRLIRNDGDWASMRAALRWDIPADFNMAQACCDSWAGVEPDRVALIDLNGDAPLDWTYGALKDASDRLAASFRAAGVTRGDTVAVLLPQGAAVPIAHFAAMKLGAVALPLFTLFGSEALAYRLSDSAAKVVVTDGENLSKVLALQADLPALSAVYAISGATGDTLDLWAEIEAHAPITAPEPVGAEDPGVLIYTSGTTGAPKGVLHAHRFLMGHLPSMELTHEGFPRPGDCGWTPADWAWIGGLMDMAMPCLYYGVPLIAKRMRKFDPAEAYALIARYKVRNLFLPPTALKLMRGTPVPEGVNIRSVSSGGESLGAEMLAWGRDTLGAPINELYGQTECNLVVSMCAGFMKVKPGAMGQALPGHDVAILRADGTKAAPDELGEICVRRGSPSMFLRYLNKPDQTDAKFRGDWLRTGDLGRCDADGYFTYVARDDDVITSAGYRIGPSEIEDCLQGHPDVVMAAVIGVPDPVRTEAVKAFVVLREGAEWDGLEKTLIDRVKARVSPHVAPRAIERRDSLPMTATGKIMRRELRAAEVDKGT